MRKVSRCGEQARYTLDITALDAGDAASRPARLRGR